MPIGFSSSLEEKVSSKSSLAEFKTESAFLSGDLKNEKFNFGGGIIILSQSGFMIGCTYYGEGGFLNYGR